MIRAPSTILFALVLAFALVLLGWWTLFQDRESRRLERAGQALAAGLVEEAARALGGEDPAALTDLARRRRSMFRSEGAVFGVMLVLAGVLFLAQVRSEARLRRNQDSFLAGATHELKTPLATIRLLLESLQQESVPAHKRQRHIGSGLLELERLERGLTNLLTAAGLRSTQRTMTLEVGDLSQDLGAAMAALAQRAEAAGITVEAGELPAVSLARDPAALQLVLRNLLDNAIKYSPRGARVAATLTATDREAVITVTDPGRGMDAEELAQAFQPFYRGADQSVGGAGLGLHLVRELVTAHGGTVTARSAGRDQGAELTVRLPRGESP